MRLAGVVSLYARQGGPDRAHATFILLGKARAIVESPSMKSRAGAAGSGAVLTSIGVEGREI
jgi:hypothetical protein